MPKNTTTVTIDNELLEKARNLGVNVSAAAEQGVKAEVASIERERLKKMYREAHAEIDREAESQGLFSDGMRQF